jgi:hypothetical protein
MPNEITEQTIDELKAEITRLQKMLLEVYRKLNRIDLDHPVIDSTLNFIDRELLGDRDAR